MAITMQAEECEVNATTALQRVPSDDPADGSSSDHTEQLNMESVDIREAQLHDKIIGPVLKAKEASKQPSQTELAGESHEARQFLTLGQDQLFYHVVELHGYLIIESQVAATHGWCGVQVCK